MLVGLCALGFIFGSLQNSARIKQQPDRVGNVIRFFIEPLAVPLSSTTRGIADFAQGLASARRLASDNRRLKQIEQAMQMYLESMEFKDREIARLRAMQGFGPIVGHKRIPASVCGVSLNENRLTLNVGSRQGVKLGCPVECADGLVGTIEEVGSDQCQVLMLTSVGLQTTSTGKTQLVGALDVNRNPPLLGVVRGENASTLSMTFFDPKAPVQIGDLIVTSGSSEKIPPNLTIGKVIQTESNEEFGTLKARLSPAFELGTLDVVFVLA